MPHYLLPAESQLFALRISLPRAFDGLFRRERLRRQSGRLRRVPAPRTPAASSTRATAKTWMGIPRSFLCLGMLNCRLCLHWLFEELWACLARMRHFRVADHLCNLWKYSFNTLYASLAANKFELDTYYLAEHLTSFDWLMSFTHLTSRIPVSELPFSPKLRLSRLEYLITLIATIVFLSIRRWEDEAESHAKLSRISVCCISPLRRINSLQCLPWSTFLLDPRSPLEIIENRDPICLNRMAVMMKFHSTAVPIASN